MDAQERILSERRATSESGRPGRYAKTPVTEDAFPASFKAGQAEAIEPSVLNLADLQDQRGPRSVMNDATG